MQKQNKQLKMLVTFSLSPALWAASPRTQPAAACATVRLFKIAFRLPSGGDSGGDCGRSRAISRMTVRLRRAVHFRRRPT